MTAGVKEGVPNAFRLAAAGDGCGEDRRGRRLSHWTSPCSARGRGAAGAELFAVNTVTALAGLAVGTALLEAAGHAAAAISIFGRDRDSSPQTVIVVRRPPY